MYFVLIEWPLLENIIKFGQKIAKFFLVDECSEDYYIGRDDFFSFFVSGKVLKLVHGKISFHVQFITFVKRNANSTIEQQKCKGREKRDELSFESRFPFLPLR